jgi:hypothetical protein
MVDYIERLKVVDELLTLVFLAQEGVLFVQGS